MKIYVRRKTEGEKMRIRTEKLALVSEKLNEEVVDSRELRGKSRGQLQLRGCLIEKLQKKTLLSNACLVIENKLPPALIPTHWQREHFLLGLAVTGSATSMKKIAIFYGESEKSISSNRAT